MAPYFSGIASAAACAIGRSLLITNAPNEPLSGTSSPSSYFNRPYHDFRRAAHDLNPIQRRGVGETKSLCAVLHHCREMERHLNQAELTAIEGRSRIAAHLNEESLRRASVHQSWGRSREQFDTQSFRSDRHFSKTSSASRAAAALKQRLSSEGAQPSGEGLDSGATAVLRVLKQCQQLEEDLAARKWDQRTPSLSIEGALSSARPSRSEPSWSRGPTGMRDRDQGGGHENGANTSGKKNRTLAVSQLMMEPPKAIDHPGRLAVTGRPVCFGSSAKLIMCPRNHLNDFADCKSS